MKLAFPPGIIMDSDGRKGDCGEKEGTVRRFVVFVVSW